MQQKSSLLQPLARAEAAFLFDPASIARSRAGRDEICWRQRPIWRRLGRYSDIGSD
jgi:hypothetical protein